MPASAKLESVFSALVDLFGPNAVCNDPAEVASFAVNGSLPDLTVAPNSLEQVAAVVKLTSHAGLAIVPWGTGTKQEIGGYQLAGAVVLSLRRLSRILEVDAGNQTVTCEAGVRLVDLDRELRREQLWLPLDPDDFDEATIGGTLATNASGPRRLRYRTARDYLLGMKLVTPHGEIVQVGRKAIKDVAGYDLRKLMIGAWGTLGIIGEVTLRLLPTPETAVTLVYQFANLAGASRFIACTLQSQLQPSAIELLDRKAGDSFARELGLTDWQPADESSLVLVQIEGMVEEIEYQVPELNTLAKQENAYLLETMEIPQERLWSARRRLDTLLRDGFPAAVKVKASVPLGTVVPIISEARQCAARHGVALSTLSHAGSGVIYYYLQVPGSPPSTGILDVLAEIGGRTIAAGGFTIMEYGPAAVRSSLSANVPRADFRLMRSIKTALDPAGTLNPDRLEWLGI